MQQQQHQARLDVDTLHVKSQWHHKKKAATQINASMWTDTWRLHSFLFCFVVIFIIIFVSFILNSLGDRPSGWLLFDFNAALYWNLCFFTFHFSQKKCVISIFDEFYFRPVLLAFGVLVCYLMNNLKNLIGFSHFHLFAFLKIHFKLCLHWWKKRKRWRNRKQ